MSKSKKSFNYRRSVRLRGYDYRQAGIYFVTICTCQRSKLFGDISDGEMTLSPLGEVASEEWRRLPYKRSNVRLDRYVIMPNHVHGLFVVANKSESDSSHRAASHRSKRPRGFPPGSLGAIVSHYKAAVTRRAWSGLIDRGQRIWQRNYYDHIVRSEKALNDIRRYIIQNPARWAEDSLYVE